MKTLYLLADLLRSLADRLDQRPLPPAAVISPHDRVRVRVLHPGGDVTDIHGVVGVIGGATPERAGYVMLREERAS